MQVLGVWCAYHPVGGALTVVRNQGGHAAASAAAQQAASGAGGGPPAAAAAAGSGPAEAAAHKGAVAAPAVSAAPPAGSRVGVANATGTRSNRTAGADAGSISAEDNHSQQPLQQQPQEQQPQQREANYKEGADLTMQGKADVASLTIPTISKNEDEEEDGLDLPD